MTTTQTQQPTTLSVIDAQVEEVDARLKFLKAQAEAKKARSDMDEISGLTAAKELVKRDIAQAKQFATDDYAATKKDFEKAKRNADRGLKDLQTRINRFNDRYSAWDEARERLFNARLDQADAKIKIWKAAADKDRAQDTRDAKAALATLQENVALARASAAEARREHYNAKSQAALEDAAHHFDEAFIAAATRYEYS